MQNFYIMNNFLKNIIPPFIIKVIKALNKNLILVYKYLKYPSASIRLSNVYLYYGNIYPYEKQFNIDKFIGLTLIPLFKKDVRHNALSRLPWNDNSIEKIQSQDVFEHIHLEKLPIVFDDIFRVLKPNGIFRLSLPDYNSPALLGDCVFDDKGNILADLSSGSSIIYDKNIPGLRVLNSENGGPHLWFPTYNKVTELIYKSSIKSCKNIVFYQYFEDKENFVCDSIPENEMFVLRAAPHDNRARGKPISIVIDFIK